MFLSKLCETSLFTICICTCCKIHISPSFQLSSSVWPNLNGAHTGEALAGRMATHRKVVMSGPLWSGWKACFVTEGAISKNVKLSAPARKKPWGELVHCWVRRRPCKLCLLQIPQVLSSPPWLRRDATDHGSWNLAVRQGDAKRCGHNIASSSPTVYTPDIWKQREKNLELLKNSKIRLKQKDFIGIQTEVFVEL